jgi:hypothetical protein
MPSVKGKAERDVAIVKKFTELYQGGINKKNYVYSVLAKEHGVVPDRIAEIIAEARDLDWDIGANKFSSEADRPVHVPMPETRLRSQKLNPATNTADDVKKRNKRNEAIRRKFQKIYREGMKKYYVYARLAEEFGLLSERIAEIVRDKKQRTKTGAKAKAQVNKSQAPSPKSEFQSKVLPFGLQPTGRRSRSPGSGGNRTGIGGRGSDTGGRGSGIGGRDSGTGGNHSGTGGNRSGTVGRGSDTGGRASGTGGRASDTGGNRSGIWGNLSGTRGSNQLIVIRSS